MAAVEYVGLEPADDDWMRRRGVQGADPPVLPVVGRAAPGPGAPRGDGPPGLRRLHRAAATCQEFARANHEYGFWGGESEDERHAAGYRLIAPIGVRARAVLSAPATASFDVCVVGSANLDLVATTARLPAPGETRARHGLRRASRRQGAQPGRRRGPRRRPHGVRRRRRRRRRRPPARSTCSPATASTRRRRARAPTRPTGRALIVVDDGGRELDRRRAGRQRRAGRGRPLPTRACRARPARDPAATVADALRLARRDTAADDHPQPGAGAALPSTTCVDLVDVVVPNEHEAAPLGGAERCSRRSGAVVTTLGVAPASEITTPGGAHARAGVRRAVGRHDRRRRRVLRCARRPPGRRRRRSTTAVQLSPSAAGALATTTRCRRGAVDADAWRRSTRCSAQCRSERAPPSLPGDRVDDLHRRERRRGRGRGAVEDAADDERAGRARRRGAGRRPGRRRRRQEVGDDDVERLVDRRRAAACWPRRRRRRRCARRWRCVASTAAGEMSIASTYGRAEAGRDDRQHAAAAPDVEHRRARPPAPARSRRSVRTVVGWSPSPNAAPGSMSTRSTPSADVDVLPRRDDDEVARRPTTARRGPASSRRRPGRSRPCATASGPGTPRRPW